jgi:tRNA-dihydrouridine synthase
MGEPDNLVSMVDGIIQKVDIPVSAKMRLGTGQGDNNALEICKELEDIGTARLCVHGRTLRQRYSGEADWNSIKSIVDAVETPVVANGDVVDAASAKDCLEVTGASGLMVGRGAIGRPSVFGEIKVGLGWMEHDDLPWVRANGESWHELSPVGQSFAARRWCWDKYIEFSHKTSGLQPRWMQRHAVAFTKGLPGAKKIRAVMHGAPTPEAFADGISSFLSAKSGE